VQNAVLPGTFTEEFFFTMISEGAALIETESFILVGVALAQFSLP
jgi:hypothetical protein